MAFRFYNGRIVTDEEFYELGTSSPKTIFIGLTHAFGIFATWIVPAVGLAALGYLIAQNIGLLIGLILGGIISYVLYEVLIKIFQILIGIIAIGLVITFIGIIIYVILSMK